MSTYKKKQKELRSPDAFQKAGQEAIPWLVHNQVRLLVLVILIVVGGAAAALWAYSKQRAELREAEAFSKALAPLMPPRGGADAVAKTPSEMDAELLEALQAFEAQSQGDTPAARNAQLLLAYLYLRMENPEEALHAAQRFLDKAPPGHPLRLSALEAKGYALEQSRQYEPASAVFGEFEASNTQEALRGKGEYHQARMLLLQGQPREALALFEKIAALDLPGNEAVELSRQRVEELSRVQQAGPAEPVAGNEADNEAN